MKTSVDYQDEIKLSFGQPHNRARYFSGQQVWSFILVRARELSVWPVFQIFDIVITWKRLGNQMFELFLFSKHLDKNLFRKSLL